MIIKDDKNDNNNILSTFIQKTTWLPFGSVIAQNEPKILFLKLLGVLIKLYWFKIYNIKMVTILDTAQDLEFHVRWGGTIVGWISVLCGIIWFNTNC